MLILTGTDGFIGKNVLQKFSDECSEEILTVDFNAQVDPFQFLENLSNDVYGDWITTIIHNGACSDTTCSDPLYIMKHNFDYCVSLFKECKRKNIRLIYASSAAVYGDGPFIESTIKKPKNLYALSKSMFDDYCFAFENNCVGLRYFNVYGPHENQKGDMSSVVYKFFTQLEKGKIRLFEDSDKYFRDFIHVDDVCDIIYKIHQDESITGIYNLGTGQERTFKEIADIFVKRYDVDLEYIPMPSKLIGKYQAYTKADTTKIKQTINHDFLTLEEGVTRYLNFLENS